MFKTFSIKYFSFILALILFLFVAFLLTTVNSNQQLQPYFENTKTSEKINKEKEEPSEKLPTEKCTDNKKQLQQKEGTLWEYWIGIKKNIIQDFYFFNLRIFFPVRNIEIAGRVYDITPFENVKYWPDRSPERVKDLDCKAYRLLKKLFDNNVQWEDISDQLYLAMNSFWNQLKLILKPFNKIPPFLFDKQIYRDLWELHEFKNDETTNVFVRGTESRGYREELLWLLRGRQWKTLLETIRIEFDIYQQDLRNFWKTLSYFLSQLPSLPQQQITLSNVSYSLTDIFASRQTKFDDLTPPLKEWLENFVEQDDQSEKRAILGYTFWWWIKPILINSKVSPSLIMINDKYLDLNLLFAFTREKKQPDSKDRPEWFFFQTIIALFPNYWELDFSLLKTEIEKIDQFWNSLRNVFAAFAALPKIDTNLIINDELQFSIDAFVDLFQEVKNDLNATGILSSENKNAQNILHTLFYDRSDPTTSLQKKITAIETFLFSNYWSQMVAVFNEYEFLPKKVFPNQIDNLSLKTLFQNRAFADTWKEEQNTLQKITSQFTIDELQTSIDQKLNSFWLELKVILKSAKSTKKKNKVVVGEQEYSLFNLLEQTDTTTSGSEMTGEARKELLLLLQDGVDEKDLKLVLLDKNELLAQTKNKSLALGLGAMGGLVGVTGLGGFVFWLVKKRS